MTRLGRLRIGTLLFIIQLVSILGTSLVAFGAIEHQLVELRDLRHASLQADILTTTGRGVTGSETLAGLSLVNRAAGQTAVGSMALLAYAEVLGHTRDDALGKLHDSAAHLKSLVSAHRVGADVRGPVLAMADALAAMETSAAARADLSEQRMSVMDSYQGLVSALKQHGNLAYSTSALVDFTTLSCRVLDTAVAAYLPDVASPEASLRAAVEAYATEMALVSQLRDELDSPYDSGFYRDMTEGEQGAYVKDTGVALQSFWSAQTISARTTNVRTIDRVIARLGVVTSNQDALGERVIAAATKAHDQARKIAYIYVLGALVSATLTQLASFVVVRAIKQRLLNSAARARAVAGGSAETIEAPYVVHSELDQIDAALATASQLVAQVSAATSAIARGEVELELTIPGAIGEATTQALDRILTDRRALVDSLELLDAIIASAPSAIWTLDENGVVSRANSAAAELVGGGRTGRHYSTFLPTVDLSRTRGLETTVSSPTGETPVLVSSSPVLSSGGGVMYVLLAHDISERKQFEDVLANMAVTDALTKLPNRAGITAALDELRSSGRSAAVLFIDLDRFKAVNDTYGHAAGDELLVSCSRRIASTIKQGDLAGRLSGDEFVVVLNDVDQTAAVAVAERLLELIKTPYQLTGCTAVIGGSIGVVTTGSAALPGDLLAAADAAMYTAKTAGRGRVMVYDQAMADSVTARASLENALRAAVAEEKLTVAYQPIVSLATGDTSGYEMLVRWDHEGQAVSPAVFIPIAEEIGVVTDIGMFMLDQAAAHLARREDPHYVSVNISAAHLAKGTLAEDVIATLERHHISGSGLVIEVTETSLVTDMDAAIVQLETLRTYGATISLDDFGTGYASLNYLRSLPADILKIDKSFITGTVDTEIVQVILNLAETLNLTVVAEGIETMEQLEALRALGCHCGQGFYFGRPSAHATPAAAYIAAG